MSKPVIAAVEGYAVAGGLELALWCDLRVASEEAVFGVFCRRWGVPLIDGGTVRLPRIVGYSHAMDMVLTGREVLSREAKDIGLINRMVPTGSARVEAEMLAAELAALPQVSLRNDRRSLMASLGRSVEDGMKTEFDLGVQTIGSAETAAGTARFVSGEGRHGT
jgi:enoyl-CoA hydratase